MSAIGKLVSFNLQRLRELKKLSQKEISSAAGIPQSQYSRIENGKAEPAISTLEKLAKVFEVSITEFFRKKSIEEELDLPLLDKLKLLDTLGKDEQKALLKMIDIAITNKKLRDTLTSALSKAG